MIFPIRLHLNEEKPLKKYIYYTLKIQFLYLKRTVIRLDVVLKCYKCLAYTTKKGSYTCKLSR